MQWGGGSSCIPQLSPAMFCCDVMKSSIHYSLVVDDPRHSTFMQKIPPDSGIKNMLDGTPSAFFGGQQMIPWWHLYGGSLHFPEKYTFWQVMSYQTSFIVRNTICVKGVQKMLRDSGCCMGQYWEYVYSHHSQILRHTLLYCPHAVLVQLQLLHSRTQGCVGFHFLPVPLFSIIE